jgi:ankyrin repeat protein
VEEYDPDSKEKEACFETIKFLLEHGANVNVTYAFLGTPLINAIFKCDADLVKLLLQHGADPNLPDSKGRTPLFYAASTNQHEIVKLLKQYGASSGKTALWFFSFKKYLPHEYSCSERWHNGEVTIDCGSFTIRYALIIKPGMSDFFPFRIESNFSGSINRQIISLAGRSGIRISTGFDLTPALIKWMIKKIPQEYWASWNKVTYESKIIIVATGLNNLILNADFKTLNMILEDFIKEKFGG